MFLLMVILVFTTTMLSMSRNSYELIFSRQSLKEIRREFNVHNVQSFTMCNKQQSVDIIILLFSDVCL